MGGENMLPVLLKIIYHIDEYHISPFPTIDQYVETYLTWIQFFFFGPKM